MTLVLKLDLDIVKMYHHTKNEVSMSTQTDRQTHTRIHYENITSTTYVEVIMSHDFDLINKPICSKRNVLQAFEAKKSTELVILHGCPYF